VESGLVSGIVAREGGKVGFVFTMEPHERESKAPLCKTCEDALRALPDVTSVTAVMTAHNATPIPPRPQSGYNQPRERAQWNLNAIEHVGRVVAIASGKGGVGKSTTTVNLAHALARAGKRVGVLDADIYGPSVPRMMGLQTGEQPAIEGGKMQPPMAHGIPCMSMGFITGEEAAVLRGPIISKALQQMLRMTRWGSDAAPLDTLLVDMPPGTGDIHLSLAQQVPLSGAIIITTPQAVATMDARKCLIMFQKLGVPILGVVENMSGEMFGHGGGKALAAEFDVPFLGDVALDVRIREAGDSGQAAPRETYDAIARRL